MYARGTIVGITRGTKREHIVRAALESIAYQSADMLASMEADADIRLATLKADGGAAVNNFLMQFQADLLGRPVIRPANLETTAMGAAYFAGLSSGLFSDLKDIADHSRAGKRILPVARCKKNTGFLRRLAPGGRALQKLDRAILLK